MRISIERSLPLNCLALHEQDQAEKEEVADLSAIHSQKHRKIRVDR